MARLTLLSTFLLVLAAAAPARADRLFVKGGGVIEGEVSREGAAYRVKLARGGEALVPVEDVERVETGQNAHEEYARRLVELDRTDADGHWKLGLFCRDHAMKQEAEALFRHAIAVVPTHEGAHAALGEVLYQGRWVPQEEACLAQGQVKLGGRWVTPDERDRILRVEAIRGWTREVRRLSYRARSIDADTRRAAAETIAAIEDPLAVEALVEFSRHYSSPVRLACARALCRFGADERVPAELVRLSARDDDLDLRDAVIASLADARIEAVGERLLADYVRADEAWIRKASARALGGIHFKPAFYSLVATLTFHVQREELVPTDGVGFLVAAGHESPLDRRRLFLRSYGFQSFEYRVVEDLAFNDAARAALISLTGRNFDFDRYGWDAWWRENEKRLDLWMRPVRPPPAKPAPSK